MAANISTIIIGGDITKESLGVHQSVANNIEGGPLAGGKRSPKLDPIPIRSAQVTGLIPNAGVATTRGTIVE